MLNQDRIQRLEEGFVAIPYGQVVIVVVHHECAFEEGDPYVDGASVGINEELVVSENMLYQYIHGGH